jgi:hypothetical protein
LPSWTTADMTWAQVVSPDHSDRSFFLKIMDNKKLSKV